MMPPTHARFSHLMADFKGGQLIEAPAGFELIKFE
jgi:hypothetical protein